VRGTELPFHDVASHASVTGTPVNFNCQKACWPGSANQAACAHSQYCAANALRCLGSILPTTTTTFLVSSGVSPRRIVRRNQSTGRIRDCNDNNPNPDKIYVDRHAVAAVSLHSPTFWKNRLRRRPQTWSLVSAPVRTQRSRPEQRLPFPSSCRLAERSWAWCWQRSGTPVQTELNLIEAGIGLTAPKVTGPTSN
jgi:hypothetical protein